MNKKLLILILLVLPVAKLLAGTPDWSVIPSNYSYSMTITGVIYLDGVESSDENDIIAAFSGNNCVGLASPVYNSLMDRYFYFLMIYSNTATQVVSFKIYDASSDKIIDVEETVQFGIDKILGQIDEPWISSKDKLTFSVGFLNFSIPGEIDEAIIGEEEIVVLLPSETDLTSLTPEFTLDLYATTKVNGLVQRSGLSVQDFSNPVIYVVRGVNGSNSKAYTVKVFANDYAEFEAYNVITPNGDGKNDVWKIKNPDVYRNCEFFMYYGTGKLLWSSIGYNNDWDGKTLDGKELPMQTYYYVVKCNECSSCKISGSVSLIK